MLSFHPKALDPLASFEYNPGNPRQANYNTLTQARLESGEEGYVEKITDCIQFANWITPNLPGVTIYVTSAPFLQFEGEIEGHAFQITLGYGFGGFSINGSVDTPIEMVGERIKVWRQLLTYWETILKHLPDGFIIYGPDALGKDHPSFASRQKVLSWIGFGPVDDNSNDRFGQLEGDSVKPLTAEEFYKFSTLEELYNQRFMVESITWSSNS
jgi:hypothetical protein